MTCCFTCLLLLPLFSRNTYNLRLSIVASYDLRVVNIFYSFCSQAAGTRAKWSLWLFPLQLKPFLLPPRQRPLNSWERNTIQMPHYRYWENNAKYHKTWLNWSLSERQFRRKPAKTFSLSKRICLRIHLNLRQHEPISSRYVLLWSQSPSITIIIFQKMLSVAPAMINIHCHARGTVEHCLVSAIFAKKIGIILPW